MKIKKVAGRIAFGFLLLVIIVSAIDAGQIEKQKPYRSYGDDLLRNRIRLYARHPDGTRLSAIEVSVLMGLPSTPVVDLDRKCTVSAAYMFVSEGMEVAILFPDGCGEGLPVFDIRPEAKGK